MALYLLSGNTFKIKEIKTFVPHLEVVNIDLPEIQEVDSRKVIEAKLVAASKHIKGSLIVEDTSLCLDCIPGLPGPLIKWFQKTLDNNGIYEIAKRFNIFGAHATVMIGLLEKNGGTKYFEGTIEGTIVPPRGENGFGWDSIFQPTGHDKTFAEMDQTEKNTVSMRRIAAEKLGSYLGENSSYS